MSTKKLQEEINVLDELIRSVAQNLEPHDTLKALQHKQLRDRLRGKYPECFLSVKALGGQTPDFFPVCNTAGMIDKRAIEISLKALGRLMNDDSGAYDSNDLTQLLSKLERMRDVYSKDIPKPPNQAGRKAVITRMMNNVKDHLKTTRTD
jgi:hypothetical protein